MKAEHTQLKKQNGQKTDRLTKNYRCEKTTWLKWLQTAEKIAPEEHKAVSMSYL